MQVIGGMVFSGGANVLREPGPSIVLANLIVHLDASVPASFNNTAPFWLDLTTGNDASVNGFYAPSHSVYSANSGGVITFDGTTTDQVEWSDNVAYRAYVGGSITLQIWAKIKEYSDGMAIFGKKHPSPYLEGYSVVLSANGVVGLKMQGNTVNATYNTNSNVWFANTWHLFTAVVSYGGSPKLYIDGDKYVDTPNGETSVFYPDAKLVIGRETDSQGNGPVMEVGAFYLYSGELPISGVQNNYNVTKSRYGL